MAQASRYILAAHLADERGDTVAYAQISTAIRAALGKGSDRISLGQPVISLSFSGQEINRTSIDGPHFVYMTLCDIDHQGGSQIDALAVCRRGNSKHSLCLLLGENWVKIVDF